MSEDSDIGQNKSFAILGSVITISVLLFLFSVVGCQIIVDSNGVKDNKQFLDAGCKKRPIIGSSGSYWVCE